MRLLLLPDGLMLWVAVMDDRSDVSEDLLSLVGNETSIWRNTSSVLTGMRSRRENKKDVRL